MSDPFVGEIRLLALNFAPRGWAFCRGQLLPISQNTALFALLGTTYGGDGKTTFALPDLQDRVPMGPGHGPGLTPRTWGETGGVASVALTEAEMPLHHHRVVASSSSATSGSPAGAVPARTGFGRGTVPTYTQGSATGTMGPAGTSTTGAGRPHENMPPYLALNWCIALQGIFPPRS